MASDDQLNEFYKQRQNYMQVRVIIISLISTWPEYFIQGVLVRGCGQELSGDAGQLANLEGQKLFTVTNLL